MGEQHGMQDGEPIRFTESVPAQGAGGPAVFRPVYTFRQMLGQLVGVLFGLWIVGAVIFLIILGYTVGGSAVVPVSVVLSALMSVGLVWLKKRQYDAHWGCMTLTLSDDGLVHENDEFRAELPWNAVERFGVADIASNARVDVNLVSTLASNSIQASQASPSSAILGAGTVTLKPGASFWARKGYRDRARGREVRAETGQTTTAIIPAHFEHDWQHGRIGALIRHYRPDLQF